MDDLDWVAAFCSFTLIFGVTFVPSLGLNFGQTLLAEILFTMFWAIMMAVFRIANRTGPRSVTPAKEESVIDGSGV